MLQASGRIAQANAPLQRMSNIPPVQQSPFQVEDQGFGETMKQDQQMLNRLNTERLGSQFPAFNDVSERSFDLMSDVGAQNFQRIQSNADAISKQIAQRPAMETQTDTETKASHSIACGNDEGLANRETSAQSVDARDMVKDLIQQKTASNSFGCNTVQEIKDVSVGTAVQNSEAASQAKAQF